MSETFGLVDLKKQFSDMVGVHARADVLLKEP